ncbi:nucleotidyltransferase [Pseudoalteromonas lipolytica]|uniref:nucleotidyltransferase domain-containing protein n=1 Tax=Pseudoalteromonas lipolytica TaxID=570156 RepID=UPI0030A6C02A
MAEHSNNAILEAMLSAIELPDSAYEKAESRYKDLGEWLHREESKCSIFEPKISPQGSFRLGTANRPFKGEEYDLDMSCNLQEGLTKDIATQEQLKNLVGDDLEQYRKARGIQSALDEKRRCWRLDYADGISFHMDIVPCIPEDSDKKAVLEKRMIESSKFSGTLAEDVSNLAVSITDNSDPNYSQLSDDWRISNPEGYAQWFESRMRLAEAVLNNRMFEAKASIEELPNYQWKTPLQMVIKLLKRHRDTMFENDDESKPISIIITTLAAKAYSGESDLVSAMENILNNMAALILPTVPRVPNPVNPVEDFADKWYSNEHKHLNLEANFHRWVLQAQADFEALRSQENVKNILEAAKRGFNLNLDSKFVSEKLGLAPSVVPAPKVIPSSPTRPWYKK